MGMDEQSLLVSSDDHIPITVSRQAITRLDVSTGRHRRVLKGMMIGGGIGALFGAGLKSDNCQNAVTVCSTSIVGAEAYGILGGAAWGAVIGALFKGDRWSDVPLERVRVLLDTMSAAESARVGTRADALRHQR